MADPHWTMTCKGDFEYPIVALHFRRLPWRYIEYEPLWLVTGIDCQGRCTTPFRRIYALIGRIYPWTAKPWFDASGVLVDSRFLNQTGFDLDPTQLSFKDTPVESLPDDIIVDTRTVEHWKNKCCPPQLEALMFEGIEMI